VLELSLVVLWRLVILLSLGGCFEIYDLFRSSASPASAPSSPRPHQRRAGQALGERQLELGIFGQHNAHQLHADRLDAGIRHADRWRESMSI
jgi:hypothetical protein